MPAVWTPSCAPRAGQQRTRVVPRLRVSLPFGALALVVVAASLVRAGTSNVGDLGTLAQHRPPLVYDSAAPRLHVALTSIPLWGHFKPLWVIAEELAHRGHAVTCVVEKVQWCDTVLRHSRHRRPITLANSTLTPVTEATRVNIEAAASTGRESEAPNGVLDVWCVVIPSCTAAFSADTFAAVTSEQTSMLFSFQTLFNDMLQYYESTLPDLMRATNSIHARHRVTTMLCDLATYACAAVGRMLDVSVVQVLPLTTQLTVGVQALLPAVGTGFPRHMSVSQRFFNWAFKHAATLASAGAVKRINAVRTANAIPPLRDAYDAAGMYGPVVTFTLWGLDIAQPLCPNVHPVGPLNTRDERAPYNRDDLPRDLADFLDSCPRGVVYVNWGTLAAPDANVVRRLHNALLAVEPLCVVWKHRGGTPPARAGEPLPSSPARMYITAWLPSVVAVLKHPHTRAFLTHCGDNSVLESIEAEVPLIGVPLFADQADVCQRVAEAGIGVQASTTKTFTHADIVSAIAAVDERHDAMVRRMRELRLIATAAGGASRAADVVETRHFNLLSHRNTTLEACRELDGALSLSTITSVWASVVIGSALLCAAALLRLWRWRALARCRGWVWTSLLRKKPGAPRPDKPPPRPQAAPRPHRRH